MTGERFDADELSFDDNDDEFVLDDDVDPSLLADDGEGDDIFAEAGTGLGGLFNPDRPQEEQKSTGDDPEDMLFTGPDELEAESQFGGQLKEQFDEDSQEGWGGSDIMLESIIGAEEVEDTVDHTSLDYKEDEDPFIVEDVELELIGGADPQAQDASGFGEGRQDVYFGEDQDQPEEVGVAAAAADDDWAVVDEGDEDAIYGDAAPAAEPEYAEQAEYEETDYSEHEESFVEAGVENQPVHVSGAREARQFPFRGLLASAALLTIAAVGGVMYFKPEWLKMKTTPELIDRVEIARPDTGTDLLPPEVDLDPVVEDPVVEDPVIEDPVVVDPVIEDPVIEDPVIEDPVIEDPVIVDPVIEDPVIVTTEPGRIPDVDPSAADQFEPIPIGDNLLVSPHVAEAAVETPFPDLIPGINAFAQLRNDSFFIGAVKKLNTDHVTLRLEKGEVSLHYAHLKNLEPLIRADQSEITDMPYGYVRLKTKTRIFGSIMRTSDEDFIVIKTEKSRISIPRDQIESSGAATRGGVQVAEDEDDAWVNEKAAERLQSRSRGITNTVPIPDPSGRGR